jgi:hypothetical protein
MVFTPKEPTRCPASRFGCDTATPRELDKYAPVAQLDRALVYETKGRVFESRRAHQFNSRL